MLYIYDISWGMTLNGRPVCGLEKKGGGFFCCLLCLLVLFVF